VNPYDEDLKPGDRLIFTDEVEIHLANLGIPHRLEYGDELIVLDDHWERKFPIQIADVQDPTWTAWIYRTIDEGARDFWLKSQELAPEGEGVSSPLPPAYWSKAYLAMSRE
jgi:hypothetical protein